MVILGLGTNLGNRMQNLRSAIAEIKALGVTDLSHSIVYETEPLLPEGAPSSWDISYYNMVVSFKTEIAPHDLLLKIKDIEKKLGRVDSQRWAPRMIDIDILLYNDAVIKTAELTIPHYGMLERAFVLLPLYQLSPNTYHPIAQKKISEIVGHIKKTPDGILRAFVLEPKVAGIINLTTDSFSNDGIATQTDIACQKALEHIQFGASILEIGAQATNYLAHEVSPQEEFSRLSEFLKHINKEIDALNQDVILSIDSYRYDVLKRLADKFRIDIINDVSGLHDLRIVELARSIKAKYIVVHSLGVPTGWGSLMDINAPCVPQILAWAQHKIASICGRGFSISDIIFDPGIGFGKVASQSIEIIREIGKFQELSVDIMLGHSRKSFISTFAPTIPEERDIETAVLGAIACKDVDYIRVHNPYSLHRAMVSTAALS